MEMKSIFTNSKISIETRKRFLKCYIWYVLLYGSESWTISAESKRKLEAMKMWCYRRMLKISWTEFVSNEKVFGQVKEEQRILASITQRQLKFFGLIIRENNLVRLVLEGKIDGSRSEGRQRKKYLDDLAAAVGCLRKGELFHLTRDRERFMVAIVNWHGTTRRRCPTRLMIDGMHPNLLLHSNNFSIYSSLLLNLTTWPTLTTTRGGARNFPTGGADSANEGAKIRFSGYFKYQESPKKSFTPLARNP